MKSQFSSLARASQEVNTYYAFKVIQHELECVEESLRLGTIEPREAEKMVFDGVSKICATNDIQFNTTLVKCEFVCYNAVAMPDGILKTVVTARDVTNGGLYSFFAGKVAVPRILVNLCILIITINEQEFIIWKPLNT